MKTNFDREVYREVVRNGSTKKRIQSVLDTLLDRNGEPITSIEIADLNEFSYSNRDSMTRAIRDMIRRLRDAGHPILGSDDGYWYSNNRAEIAAYLQKRRQEIRKLYDSALEVTDIMEQKFVKRACNENQLSML